MSCIFCRNFDFGCVRTNVEISQHYIHANIVLAGGSSRFPKSEQFNFCPVCGEELKKAIILKRRAVNEKETGL